MGKNIIINFIDVITHKKSIHHLDINKNKYANNKNTKSVFDNIFT